MSRDEELYGMEIPDNFWGLQDELDKFKVGDVLTERDVKILHNMVKIFLMIRTK